MNVASEEKEVRVSQVEPFVTDLLLDAQRAVGVQYIENGVRIHLKKSEALRRHIRWVDWLLHDDAVQRFVYDMTADGEFREAERGEYTVCCEEHVLRKLIQALREIA